MHGLDTSNVSSRVESSQVEFEPNSLLYGISENLMRRVQSVQNAAARLLTGARRRDHISPVLRRLFICHWLDKLLITSPRIFTSLLQVHVARSVPLRTGRAVSHVRRQKLCRSRDSCVEQSAIESTRQKTQFSELQAPAENSLVYC